MHRLPLRVAPLLACAALLIAAPGAFAAHKKTTDVTVMTRNLFLGADLPPLALAQPGADFEAKAGAMLKEVTATDPDARMKLIAGEIAKAKPDLVGLQEVSLWRTGPKGQPPATKVRFDFLGTIVKELSKRGAHYRMVARKYGFNVEGPTDQGVDVRLTLGDAVLARRGVKVSHSRSGIFHHQLHFSTKALGDVNVNRTWNALDAVVGGARMHVVNTHLEAYSPDFRLQQAKELVKGPLRSKLPTILLGDLNSGPTLSNPADRPPYKAIAAAGFKPRRTGKFSCCFDDLAKNAGWNHNVDWIMSKPGMKLVRSSITGREKTASGLHPSDHGGVVTVLAVPR
jgi:endonuclease/exonuclease/phosphatase family metal-dependent hydrolase